jgi:ABC-2 type transport system ATP-binding protein
MKNSIVFNGVSKKFKKGRKLLLKEALLDVLRPTSTEYFWALNNVSFKVDRGTTLGIIGPNGSGKSTILKMIAGVMVPTNGKVKVIGKVAPLIELGAGFHPELSGRENIYLNGTILGMSRSEVEEKFNSIVKFSELEDFIDTPIKHYSSGMFMRLGFSIAINISPEILLIDEILTVGDEKFREKSMNKMNKLKDKGVTIVFVSHNLNLIKMFCKEVIYVSGGKIKYHGDPDTAFKKYKLESLAA